ncbi:MAG: hypothetical protein FJY56_12310 [Betaproteobacteria bacterium]|nr:hypothetical protein [Betaproteobacteria bacterium]
MAESIASSGYPLGFAVRKGAARAAVIGGAGRETFKAEARHFAAHHQKEAVVSEGTEGSAWRMVSDEGRHIKGDDLAPFPLGFYNAGLQADVAGRIVVLARARGIGLRQLDLHCVTGYSMTGSFYQGDGVGGAEPARLQVNVQSSADAAAIKTLINDAIAASPAFAGMREPITNTFALYVNGARRAVTSVPASTAPDAADPLKTYHAPPAPLAGSTTDLIVKTGIKREGDIAIAVPAAQPGQPIVRHVEGRCVVDVERAATLTRVCLQLPGMSEFALRSDESNVGAAPSGLALLSAGIVFCYMTQLARYIDYLKLDIHHMRLVQFSPFACDGRRGRVAPVDTHLFLHGNAPDETFEKLMRIAATTCFLHATLKAALPPQVIVALNSNNI